MHRLWKPTKIRVTWISMIFFYKWITVASSSVIIGRISPETLNILTLFKPISTTNECIQQPHLSASSRMTILCLPLGSVTFCWANILILLRTTSMPRSLEAFNSSTASLKLAPSRHRAKQRIVVVLPTPGGPWATERYVSAKSRLTLMP